MKLLSQRLLLFVLFISIITTGTFASQSLNLNVSSNKTTTNKIDKINALDNVVAVEKRVNNTIVSVNDTVVVEILITNYRNTPVYDVVILEQEIKNPLIDVESLSVPIRFSSLDANSQIDLIYTITSYKPGNITLSETGVSYKLTNNPSSPIYISLSQKVTITVLAEPIVPPSKNNEILILLSTILFIYSLIIIMRTIFTKGKKESST